MTQTATFTCGACGYSQKTAASAAGNSYSCPKCGGVAVAVLDGGRPAAPPPPGPPRTQAQTQPQAQPQTQQAAAKTSSFFGQATGKVRTAVGGVGGSGKAAAPQTNAAAYQSTQHPQGQAPQQASASGQTVSADTRFQANVLRVNAQSKSLALALVLTFFFGGFGTLYASIGWGIFFSILELVLWAVVFLTLGLAGFILGIFHIICIIYAAVSVSNHNKRLWNDLLPA